MSRTAPHSTARKSLVSALILAACALAPSTHAAVPADGTPSPAAPARALTVTAEYDLGDTAFTDPQTGTVSEIRAVVHYPKHLSGQLPLVVQAHGSWLACTDPTAQTWPCDKGTPEPSYRGYDYLGEQLAKRGFITVSLSANGINMTSFDYGDRARLVNEHLHLWKQLAAGKGPLAPRLPALRSHVNMHQVGTMGHSRGGKGVMWEASDKHITEVPDGVRIAAVLALAPVKFDDPEGDHSDTLVTHVPVAVVTSTCDGAVHEAGQEYLDDAEGKTHEPAYSVSVQNANHNYYNADWTPPSPSGVDDSTCPGQELTPHTQQGALTAYATAFYERFLKDDKPSTNVLTGKQPLPGVTSKVRVVQPVKRG
ncbi:alpha/beta hydrolase [Actinacidiphila glaucinigra]|uniref:alpha/beta hydrolase n=1 Tax=Actinacidiphila glaucinigra TaxID=235986 RepID=UPI0033B8259A